MGANDLDVLFRHLPKQHVAGQAQDNSSLSLDVVGKGRNAGFLRLVCAVKDLRRVEYDIQLGE